MALFGKKKMDDSFPPAPVQQEEMVQTDDTVRTKLHFSEEWDLTTKEKYVYQFYHRRLPQLKEGQLSITGIKFLEENGELIVEAFIRNTVPQALNLHEVDLIVFDENNQPTAKNRFSLDLLGEIPPFSCTPWRFVFLAEDRLSDAAVSEKWKILFELKNRPEENLDLDPAWEDRLTEDKKTQLEGMLERLPKVGPKEVNIVGVELKFLDNQSLEAVVLIRNGTSQEVQIGQLPLTVEDAAGDIVCQGQFNLPPLKVKPNSAKPWAFVYPAELILKNDADFSSWRIFVKENK
ncbi:accessory Sec system S-layer assembly protein [Neobacillus niacini]|uniref:accessory Sec system S-layer assembly protein n=1 Tax=Neobacillus niacini TaxID=86668 RepID=UPI002855F053|nr:accessory Sec system S-layer assembly protein [Neobacillus niacini]MDR7000075.1 accessory Sec system S-layer assembly protein [Neobacillus niacini]